MTTKKKPIIPGQTHSGKSTPLGFVDAFTEQKFKALVDEALAKMGIVIKEDNL